MRMITQRRLISDSRRQEGENDEIFSVIDDYLVFSKSPPRLSFLQVEVEILFSEDLKLLLERIRSLERGDLDQEGVEIFGKQFYRHENPFL